MDFPSWHTPSTKGARSATRDVSLLTPPIAHLWRGLGASWWVGIAEQAGIFSYRDGSCRARPEGGLCELGLGQIEHQTKSLAIARTVGGESPTIEGQDLADVETLGEQNEGRVGEVHRRVRVTTDEAGCAMELLGGAQVVDDHSCSCDQIGPSLGLLRQGPQEMHGLGDDGAAGDELAANRFDAASHGFVGVDPRVQIGDQRARVDEPGGQSLQFLSRSCCRHASISSGRASRLLLQMAYPFLRRPVGQDALENLPNELGKALALLGGTLLDPGTRDSSARMVSVLLMITLSTTGARSS